MPREIAGRYHIQKRLGSGAWATVYEALDTGAIDRRVAIKIFRLPPSDDVTSAEQHARFRQGARAAGRLSHPNIVSVFDFCEDNEQACLIMELVEGETLKALMESGKRLEIPTIARIMGQILDALAYTHSRGVVHRDIKPANIMLTSDRVVKIADFGVARIEDASITYDGTVIGSPNYMAPEQFRGDPVDHRADIWAAGVVLYQLLTGERPFDGSVTSIMQKALYLEPVLPSRTGNAVPEQFDAVVTKALAKRPEARFASASEFAEAVRTAAAADVPQPNEATVRLPPMQGPPIRSRPRRRWLLPTAGGAVALVAVGVAALLLRTPHLPATERTGADAALTASAGPSVPTEAALAAMAPDPASERHLASTEAAAAAALAPTATPATLPQAAPPRQEPESTEARLVPPPRVPAPVEAAAPAPVLPMPSRSVEPPPSDLRSVALIAGAAFQCGVVRASVVDDRIVFRGLAPLGEIETAQRAIAAAGLPHETAQVQAIETFDPSFCSVLARLEDGFGGNDAPAVSLANPKPLPEGQVLRLQVRMPDWPAHLALFVLMPQGQAGQLAATGRQSPRATLTLTDPSWAATAPFGSELLLAIVSEKPLFARRRAPERLDSLAAALRSALGTARENGGRVAAQIIAVQTVPR
jgi:tRNA A-37 threonylcarbamoyl transferase component Bud32